MWVSMRMGSLIRAVALTVIVLVLLFSLGAPRRAARPGCSSTPESTSAAQPAVVHPLEPR
jgi:hypothetical protein